ncbi:MAG TPA: hypothetical protein VHN14_31745 [Kofleriaceae bacterium]|nr:hypothetical protein [Kofleriaceae bacterium]
MERLHADPIHEPVVVAPPPPPAPAGGPTSAISDEIRHKETKPTPPVPVQPRTTPAPDPLPPSEDPPTGGGGGSGDPTSTGTCTQNCGVAEPAAPVCGNAAVEAGEQCDDGNTTSGDGCSSSCQLEPRPAPSRSTVQLEPRVLQGLRISGETQLRPSTVTQDQMIRKGLTSVHGVVKVCIATSGSIASATMTVSTKFTEYDETLLSAVRAWRYRPYLFNGAPVPACSMISFIYTLH